MIITKIKYLKMSYIQMRSLGFNKIDSIYFAFDFLKLSLDIKEYIDSNKK